MTAASAGRDGRHAMEPRTGRPLVRPLGSSLPRAWLITAAVLPLLLLVLLAGVLASRQGINGAQVGSAAPGFALTDLDGNPLRLADLHGRPVIVNFWASWCGPCVEEFPLLAGAAEAHANDGLAVIGIVFRDNSESARGFMQRMGATWPAAMDPGEDVAERYGIISGPPETFFVDAEGTVVARQIGQLSASDLQRHLDRLIVKE